MKTLSLIIASVLFIGNTFAQDFPETPTTPSTSSNNKHTSVTTSISNSTSTSDSDKAYKFKSKFEAAKREGIKSILIDELDMLKKTKNKNEITWVKYIDNKVVFECKLTQRNLHIVSNKKELSGAFNSKIKNLGEELNNFISAHKPFDWNTKKSCKTLSSAQTRVENAKLELERSIKNLEKVKRERGY